MLVWRLENANGRGPICGQMCGHFIDHMPPQYQFGSWESTKGQLAADALANGWVCGWNSRELMMDFPSDERTIQTMDERGFLLFVVDVPDDALILCPDGQVVFDRSRCVFIEHQRPSEFFGPNWTPKGFYDY